MTLYQPGLRSIQEVGYGLTSQYVTCLPEVGGLVVDPSSLTADVLRPGETMDSPTLSAQVPTENSTTHVLTLSLDLSNTSTWYLGCEGVVLFKYTASSIVQPPQRVMFEVVRVPLVNHPPCNTVDVTNAHAMLTDAMQQAGITTDGTTTADPDASPYINEAWADILALLRSRGRRPALTTDPSAFAPLLRAMSRINVLRALKVGSNGLFDELAKDEQANADRALTMLSGCLKYDDGDIGSATSTSRTWNQPRLSPFRNGRTSPGRWGR